jgi:hypothetical protein
MADASRVYVWSMADGSREPHSKQVPAERHGPSARERYGPLAVNRHRKADGRALILYTVIADEQTPPRRDG